MTTVLVVRFMHPLPASGLVNPLLSRGEMGIPPAGSLCHFCYQGIKLQEDAIAPKGGLNAACQTKSMKGSLHIMSGQDIEHFTVIFKCKQLTNLM